MGIRGNDSIAGLRNLLLCLACALAACGGRTHQGTPGGESGGAAGHFAGEDTGGSSGLTGTGGAGGEGAGAASTGGAGGESSLTPSACDEGPAGAELDVELSPEVVWTRIVHFLADRDDVPMEHGTPDSARAAGDAALSLLDALLEEGQTPAGLVRFIEHWMPGLDQPDLWGNLFASKGTTLENVLTFWRSGPPPPPAFGITTDLGVLRRPGIDGRGAYLLETLFCVPVPSKPELPSPPPIPSRAEHDEQVADLVCNTCHRIFDPLGYSLEIFDAMGNERESLDDGTPVDSAGTFATPKGEVFAFTSIFDLAPQLATSCEVATCLSRRMLEHALESADLDTSTIDDSDVQRIAARFAHSSFELRTLIRSVVESPAFLR